MGAAELINLIRQEASCRLKSEYKGLELGTVTSPYPDLAVKIDHMKVDLTRDDLIICESLLTSTRIISLKSRPGTVRDLGDKSKGIIRDSNSLKKGRGIILAETAQTGGHAHSLDSFEMMNADMELVYAELKFEDVLKPGDRVLVQAVSGGQKYIVIDRVVEYV
ncbi:MAG: DUF2577 domain-containing protein [Clostridia bacterium]|nr:DUF2577 domain-containing protein [Clostridia bacterium]